MSKFKRKLSELKGEVILASNLQRSYAVEASPDSKTIRVAFSSETPVLRVADGYDGKRGEEYWEVLDHSTAGAQDLTYLQNRGAVLDEHDPKAQIGVIVRAGIDADKIGRAELEMDCEGTGLERCNQMRSGIRPHISVGYDQTRLLSETKGEDGKPVRRFAWRAHEISSVATPADLAVGVGRSKDEAKLDTSATVTTTTTTKITRMAENTQPAPEDVKAKLFARNKEITKIAETLESESPQCKDKIRSLANEALSSDMEVKDFQIRAMKEVLGAKPAQNITMEAIGLNEQEQKDYSIVRGIQSCLKRNVNIPDGLEGEVHKEMVKRSAGVDYQGFVVPHDAKVRAKTRDLNVGTFAQGGATVQTSIVTPIIELLRNRMVTDKLGITVLSGLTGNVAIPRQTGAATAYALAETATLTKSTQALDQILLSPHRVGAWNDFSRQLLIQSSNDVENFIRDDLMKVIALKWDALILNGQGAGSEPLGLMNTPGVGSVTFGGTATFAKCVAFETALATLNADAGNMAYATTPAVRGAWKTIAAALSGATAVINGAQNAIWAPSGTPGEGEVNGYRAIASNQIPNNAVVFGNWSEVIQGLYGGYDVIVNPYSRDTDAAVRITINTFGDVALRHPASFCVSADAGNQ